MFAASSVNDKAAKHADERGRFPSKIDAVPQTCRSDGTRGTANRLDEGSMVVVQGQTLPGSHGCPPATGNGQPIRLSMQGACSAAADAC